jgi:hypothetical protein
MITPTFADQTSRILSTDGDTSLVQTTISMNIPSDNILPWGFVEGVFENHASGFPVIIQIYQNDEAIHFAQTNVEDDGSYEYKFRVKNIDGDKVINVFEGDYEVRIFKTVNLNSNSLI